MDHQNPGAPNAPAGGQGAPRKNRRGHRGGRRERPAAADPSSLPKPVAPAQVRPQAPAWNGPDLDLSPADLAATASRAVPRPGPSAPPAARPPQAPRAPKNPRPAPQAPAPQRPAPAPVGSGPESRHAPAPVSAPVPEAPAPAKKSHNFRAASGPTPAPTGPGLGTYAFLDAQNISVSASRQRWKIDWFLVRKWLSDRYDVRRAIMFLGYMEEQEPMYDYFSECGYDVVFKPVRVLPNGETKGNVDAEIVLHAMAAFPHYDRAVLISGDGDFSCLVTYLRERSKLGAVVAPHARGASGFLREAAGEAFEDMAEHRAAMTYKPGRPGPKPAASASSSQDGAPKPAAKPGKNKPAKQASAPKPAPVTPKQPQTQAPRAQQAAPRPAQPRQQGNPPAKQGSASVAPGNPPRAKPAAQQRPASSQPKPQPAPQQKPQVPAPQRPAQPGKPQAPSQSKPKPQGQNQGRPQPAQRPAKPAPAADVDYSDFAVFNPGA